MNVKAAPPEGRETLASGDMVQATIDQAFGKVTTAANFDYELLMGNAEGAMLPFIAAETGESPRLRMPLKANRAALSVPGRFAAESPKAMWVSALPRKKT